MPCSTLSAAATASLVESGLEAQSTMSAPPAFSVSIRLAVSLVTWRQAETFSPASGRSCRKRSRMSSSTGISRAAQSISRWPSLASAVSFTSPSIAFKLDLTFDIVASQHLATLEVDELDEEAETDHLAAQHLDQLRDRPGGAAGRDQVVDDQHLLAGQDRVLVDVEDIVAVLQRVFDAAGREGQLARFADGDEAGAQLFGHGRTEDEPARLHGGDELDALARPAPAHHLDRLGQRAGVGEQRRDVAEHDSRDREVG